MDYHIHQIEVVPLLVGAIGSTVSSAASSSCIVGDITFAANAAIMQIWGQPFGVKAS